jgi:hypothetical protein
MRDIDLGYLAAMIDGEGTLTLAESRKKYWHGLSIRPVVQVSNTNLLILMHLLKVTGIGNVGEGTKIAGRKRNYIWRVHAKDIHGFLKAIRPHLIGKQQQCDILLRFLEHKWSYPLTPEESDLRASWVKEITLLNT